MWVNRIKPDIAVMDSDNSGIFNELKKQKIKVGILMMWKSMFVLEDILKYLNGLHMKRN